MQTPEVNTPAIAPLSLVAAPTFLLEGEEYRIVREPERARMTGEPRSSWARKEQVGMVPKRVKISANSVGWWLSELHAYMRSLPRAA